LAAVLSGIVALIVSRISFSSPKSRSTTVPTVEALSSTLPDINGDSNYKSIFNPQALNPTQLIQIGTGQNSQPFGH